MRHICLTSVLLISILQLFNTVHTLEYIFPQHGGHTNNPHHNNNGRTHQALAYTYTPPSKNIQPLSVNYYHYNHQQPPNQIRHTNKENRPVVVRQRQEQAEAGESSPPEGGEQLENPGEEHSSFTMNVKKLGISGVSKILLAIFPFVICIVVVPLLVIVIGTLLIPIVRLHTYAEGTERNLGSLGIFNNTEEDMIRSYRVISSIDLNPYYDSQVKV